MTVFEKWKSAFRPPFWKGNFLVLSLLILKSWLSEMYTGMVNVSYEKSNGKMLILNPESNGQVFTKYILPWFYLNYITSVLSNLLGAKRIQSVQWTPNWFLSIPKRQAKSLTTPKQIKQESHRQHFLIQHLILYRSYKTSLLLCFFYITLFFFDLPMNIFFSVFSSRENVNECIFCFFFYRLYFSFYQFLSGPGILYPVFTFFPFRGVVSPRNVVSTSMTAFLLFITFYQ